MAYNDSLCRPRCPNGAPLQFHIGWAGSENENVRQLAPPGGSDTARVRIMRAIGSIIGEGLCWAIFVVSVTFILVHLPEAFNGNYYYANIFTVATLVYFVLYCFALLISCVSNLIIHKYQVEPPPPPPPPRKRYPSTRDKKLDKKFQEFYTSQARLQKQILDRTGELHGLLDKVFMDIRAWQAETNSRPQQCTGDQASSGNRSTENPKPPRCAAENTSPIFTGRNWCATDQSCTNCTPENRNCTNCLKNPRCDCRQAADNEARIRNLAVEQETQLGRILEQTKIKKRMKALENYKAEENLRK